MIRIGLIGDRDDSVPAHRGIPIALRLCRSVLSVRIEFEWLATDTICLERLPEFDGLWCTPASPYRNTDLAISAIQYARENRVPFLGTCGGFQHALLEYARNVLGITGAAHAEIQPDAELKLISPLTCELVEVMGEVRLIDGSLLSTAYNRPSITVGYHCRYGLDPEFAEQMTSKQFKVAAFDSNQAIRAMELCDHPFYVVTLFQPERAALEGVLPPIVEWFARTCVANAGQPDGASKSMVVRSNESSLPDGIN